MGTGEYCSAREISRLILDSEAFFVDVDVELSTLKTDFLRLKEEIDFLGMEADVSRQLEFGEMTIHPSRRSSCRDANRNGLHLV